jgi:hypothetical protein
MFEFEQCDFERHSGSKVATIIPKRDVDASTKAAAPNKANGKPRDQLTDTRHLALEAQREEAESSRRWDFSFADAQAIGTRRDVFPGDDTKEMQRARACRIRKQLAKPRTRNQLADACAASPSGTERQ